MDTTRLRWTRGGDETQLFIETRWNDDKYFTDDDKRRILALYTIYLLEGTT